MGAVIQALTGSTNRDEVSVMAKQATEVASLVISLAQALATSMSQVTQTTTLHTPRRRGILPGTGPFILGVFLTEKLNFFFIFQKRSFDSVYAAEYIDGAYRTDY